MKQEKRTCPECGAVAVVPILYGEPKLLEREACDRGEILLGGCIVKGSEPGWGCTACRAKFHSPDRGRTLTLANPDWRA